MKEKQPSTPFTILTQRSVEAIRAVTGCAGVAVATVKTGVLNKKLFWVTLEGGTQPGQVDPACVCLCVYIAFTALCACADCFVAGRDSSHVG